MQKSKRETVPLVLLDPARQDPPLTVGSIGPETLRMPQRSNYFTILWIPEGSGHFASDLVDCEFHGPTFLFSNPYQILKITPRPLLRGKILRFHADFFCIETYHDEVGCNGVLFNNRYGDPGLSTREPLTTEFSGLLEQMERELATSGLAHSEVLISLLKILLIKATRLKLDHTHPETPVSRPVPAVIIRLIELIEQHYGSLHRPQDYASLLFMTPKALGKLTKQHTGRTLSELIRECIIRHSKWQLLHTRHPVKQIAAEAGYADELYFSRIFKEATGLAPSHFRKIETEIRGGRNFSM